MAATVETTIPAKAAIDAKLAKNPGLGGMIIFGLILAAGMFYAASHLISDLSVEKATTIRPFVMLAGALLIALGFEFVNGFHDTANAVATVIYTHSLEPHIAVAWSGLCNFAGVLLSTGAVAFGILSLLPVELILQVGSSGGFAMVFALLVAAMIWNLGTWYLGLPASSSHTLIGSIIGVGIANQLMAVKTGTSGVDWSQAANIGKSLLVSPLVGFALAAGAAADREGADHRQAPLRGSGRNRATAVLDSRPAHSDLHCGEFRAWLQRRSERHGPHHADSDRAGADGLCAQSRGARKRDAGLRRCVGSRPIKCCSKYLEPGAVIARSARRNRGIHPHQAVHSRYDARPAPDHQRHFQRTEDVRADGERSPAVRPQLPQRHVPDQRSASG